MRNVRELFKEAFSAFGRELESFGCTPQTRSMIENAVAENGWFTPSDIIFAARALGSRMLAENVVEEWLSYYRLPETSGKRVAVIMAGNIPFAGFSDLLCVVASGHIPYVKRSSKDRVLMGYALEVLHRIGPGINIEEYNSGMKYDAVIASGSDNTGLYFRKEFAGLPSIIRGSRSSVAVLRGGETSEELKLLGRDIFIYSGLGCRNVSLVFVPDGYDMEFFGEMVSPGKENLNPKYYNNYRSTKGRLRVEGCRFIDCGTFVITFADRFPSLLSNIVAFRYKDMAEVDEWLSKNDGKVQCVAGESIRHVRSVNFGESQLPRPWDYPDGIDVMKFLAAL